MHALGVGRTDVGRRREKNEDRILVDLDLGLFVVADGMGGHAAGDVAAQTAIEAVARSLEEDRASLDRVINGQEPPALLTTLAERAATEANRQVHLKATKRSSSETMGCTLTILLVAGSNAALAQVGDSRLYLLRSGAVHQLSTDHTLVAELTRTGALTPEEAREHPYGHMLTRAIGIQERVRVDTLLLEVGPEDRFLLCSDGLHYYTKDLELLGQYLGSDDFDSIPAQLVSFANQAGGGDNISAVVVRVDPDPPERPNMVSLTTAVRVKLTALSSVFLFEGLSLALLARVLNVCHVRRCERGELLIEEGRRISQMIMVAGGELAISRCGVEVAVIGQGGHVGETALLRPRAARASVYVKESALILVLDDRSFRDLARSQPWLGVTLMEQLARQLSKELEEAYEIVNHTTSPPDCRALV
jgi:serine/threonine protein phosphatase PrpC